MTKTFTPEDILPDGDDHTTSVNPFTGFRGKVRKYIALLDRLFISNVGQEQIADVKKAVVELMPSLKAIGVFDFFNPIEWINLEHLGRTYVALLYLNYYPDEINKEVVDKLKNINHTTQHPLFQSEFQNLVRNKNC